MPTPYGDITTTQTWLTPAEEPSEECTCVETRTNASCEICEPTLVEDDEDDL